MFLICINRNYILLNQTTLSVTKVAILYKPKFELTSNCQQLHNNSIQVIYLYLKSIIYVRENVQFWYLWHEIICIGFGRSYPHILATCTQSWFLLCSFPYIQNHVLNQVMNEQPHLKSNMVPLKYNKTKEEFSLTKTHKEYSEQKQSISKCYISFIARKGAKSHKGTIFFNLSFNTSDIRVLTYCSTFVFVLKR